jgi:hypothetical protein
VKRVFAIVGWTILAFFAAHMILAFVSGMIFALLISFGLETAVVPRVAGFTALGLSVAVAVVVLVLGVRRRLPGTK